MTKLQPIPEYFEDERSVAEYIKKLMIENDCLREIATEKTRRWHCMVFWNMLSWVFSLAFALWWVTR